MGKTTVACVVGRIPRQASPQAGVIGARGVHDASRSAQSRSLPCGAPHVCMARQTHPLVAPLSCHAPRLNARITERDHTDRNAAVRVGTATLGRRRTSNKPAMGERMQPAKGQHKRIASVLVLAVAVAVTASSAFGQTGRAKPRAARPAPILMAPTRSRCTRQHCTRTFSTGVSTVIVAPTKVAAPQAPSFTAPTDNPAQGMLQTQTMKAPLTCDGYADPADPVFFQFFLGGTFRGNVFYKVKDTVDTTKSLADLQFCLAATFKFQTRSGPAKGVTLPNGLPGFVGVLPVCKSTPNPPCLVSKTKNGPRAVLKLLIPAIQGEDPWGRA